MPRHWHAYALLLGAGAVSVAPADLVAEVRPTPSGPKLFVNGKATSPTLFYVSLWHDAAKTAKAHEEIALAHEQGVEIVSMAIWGLPWFRADEEPDFSRYDVDVWIERALAANPNALLLPRFPTDWPPEWWREAHPEDVMRFDNGERDGPASVHSLAWRRDAAEQVKAMVRHLESKYGDRIIGYHPCGQTSAEWFVHGMWEGRLAGFEGAALEGYRRHLHGKYRTEDALRRAWHRADAAFDSVRLPTMQERTTTTTGGFRDPAVEQPVIDFHEFQNLDMADAVAAMCRAVKEAAPSKLAVAFYGYQFELSGAPHGLASSGHLGLKRLLESTDVDILASPVAYGDRQPGGGGYFMSPVDSVLRNGKLWLIEDDTRTHLSEPDAFPGRCETLDETEAVLSRNFAHILTRGAAVWWMDIGGTGWFADRDLWRCMGRLKRAYDDTLPAAGGYHPEIAVIVDERSCDYAHPSPAVTARLMDTFRRDWYRIGAPVGVYLLDDLLAGNVHPARLYIFVNTFRLDPTQLRAIRNRVCRDGRVVVWMYAPGIVRDGVLSSANIEAATGVRSVETPTGDGNLIVEATGREFSAEHEHLTPQFAVADPRAEVLARYANGGDVAIAARDIGGWTSVYCGALRMPSGMLRGLASRAGARIYADDDDVLMAGNGFVGIHACSRGVKALHMPGACRLEDIHTGETTDRAARFSFPMAKGETRLMRVVR